MPAFRAMAESPISQDLTHLIRWVTSVTEGLQKSVLINRQFVSISLMNHAIYAFQLLHMEDS